MAFTTVALEKRLGKALSPQEARIMDLVVSGTDRVKLIAHALGIHERTTESHIQSIRAKYGVNTLLQAALAYDRQKRGEQ